MEHDSVILTDLTQFACVTSMIASTEWEDQESRLQQEDDENAANLLLSLKQ
jgi:hypothetical protein